MPVRKITEQQFKTRRKDRRMVWVDTAALLVGLLVLAVSVGGIIVVEPEPEPIEWEYSFREERIAQSWGADTSCFQEGCIPVTVPKRPQPEGTQMDVVSDEVTLANVTQLIFTLTWTDLRPEDLDAEDAKDYPYDENSTDTFRLEITSPSGDNWSAEGTNGLEFFSGKVEIPINITPLPEPGKMHAFERGKVHEALAAQHTVSEHDAVGPWKMSVTMVRAGDQEGTVPTEACPDEAEDAPQDAQDACYLNDEMHKNRFNGQSFEDYLQPVPDYESTYDDPGNGWLLDMTVRYWVATVDW